MRLISVVSGGGKITEQVASVYLLLEYKKYYNITLQVFDNESWEKENNTQWKTYVMPAIKTVLKKLNH